MIRIVWLVLFAAACARNGSTEVPTPPPDTPAQRVPPPADAAPPTASTPAELYAECYERVEMPQTDGECTTDADCVRAGCGSEICTTATAAEGLMSTCEDRPCFHVLDTCGCHEGRCTWTLHDEMPEPPGLVPVPAPVEPG